MSIESTGGMTPQVSAVATQQLKAAQQPQQPKNANQAALQQQVAPAGNVEKLQVAVEKLNDLMRSGDRSLSFSVDSSTDRVVVKVMDTKTEQVIRQIPNEQALKFAEYIEGMVGIIFEDQA